ncbi:hypothetical protein VFPPC_18585 [Pochonia chlamydosporia 170]|uniref:Uncharacterized protein n=1 Tax=Pochonia chlamydosporia 170 TaxID=1380566 RepID=A0A219APL5_METCM|nr:hypothetical protein VFPPC_18585 [Pochonia chlamydosporia 170]OWT42502.1 hypothetical protein VFPPC_18585 [Pochonia chlamydosporia 170]
MPEFVKAYVFLLWVLLLHEYSCVPGCALFNCENQYLLDCQTVTTCGFRAGRPTTTTPVPPPNTAWKPTYAAEIYSRFAGFGELPHFSAFNQHGQPWHVVRSGTGCPSSTFRVLGSAV